MNGNRKHVFLSGLGLILFGLISGLLITYQSEYVTRLAANDAYQPVFEMLARNEPALAWQELLDKTGKHSREYARAAGFHAHSINMGILIILIGLLVPLSGKYGNRNRAAVATFIAAAWLYPAGLLLKWSGLEMVGQALAATGAVTATAAFLILLISVFKSS